MADAVNEVTDRDAFRRLSCELQAVLGADGTLRDVGPAWTRSLGWPVEQLEGRTLADLAHDDDRPAVEQVLRVLADGRPVRDAELRLQQQADGHRWVRCQADPHPGGPLGYLAAQDITDALRDRDARELLEEQSRVGTWTIDPGSGSTSWSVMTHELHGTDPSDVEGSVARGLRRYPAAARETIATAFDRLTATGDRYDLELPFLAPDGSERRIRTVGRAVLRDGVVVRVHGTLEDVTERVARDRQRAELARTQQLLEESQRLARLGHFELDVVTGELTWSPVIFELLGFDHHVEPSFDELLMIVHPDDHATLRAGIEHALEHGRVELTHRIVRPDGEELVVRALMAMPGERSAGGSRLVGSVQDITETARAQDALRASEELLQRVLAATNDGWWDLDLVAGASYYSPRWWALCGYTPGELPDVPPPWRQLTHPDDLVRFDADVGAIVASGARTFVLPSAGLHRDGHRVPMVVRGLIDYDDDGTPVRISGATADVTEARQAEIAKEEFISTVSHELRTPLTSIGGALESLAAGIAGELPEATTQLMDVGLRNTRRLRLLIDDLLDLERLLTDRHPFDQVTQTLTPLLTEAIADNEPLATMHGVRFVLVERCEDLMVTVDRIRLAQVLANYLSNAAKFAPPGSDVEVRVRPDADGAPRVRVEVVDRGPGVPAELQPRIFDRFVQGDPADPRSRGGTGLGLAISREIVERHGGRTGVGSHPGRTCVWFDLPVADSTD